MKERQDGTGFQEDETPREIEDSKGALDVPDPSHVDFPWCLSCVKIGVREVIHPADGGGEEECSAVGLVDGVEFGGEEVHGSAMMLFGRCDVVEGLVAAVGCGGGENGVEEERIFEAESGDCIRPDFIDVRTGGGTVGCRGGEVVKERHGGDVDWRYVGRCWGADRDHSCRR